MPTTDISGIPALDALVRDIAESIAALPANFSVPPRVLLVGGAVRDRLLGYSSKDIDIEVHGVTEAQLHHHLEFRYPGQVVACGRSFPVFKLVGAEGAAAEIDLSLPRIEVSTGPGHTDFETRVVPDLGVIEAARRRDFTVNAIMQDPLTGELVDPFCGSADLQKKLLRVTDEQRFPEDPLRVLRACQFAARFELSLESESSELMARMVAAGDLSNLSRERITVELNKLLLLAPQPSVGLVLLHDLGIDASLLPELEVLAASDTGGDAPGWQWMSSAVDRAASILRQRFLQADLNRQQILMLSALCYGWVVQSENDWQQPVLRFFNRLSFAQEVQAAVVKLLSRRLVLLGDIDAENQSEPSDAVCLRLLRREARALQPLPLSYMLSHLEACPVVTQDGRHSADLVSRLESLLADNPITTMDIEPLLSGKDLIASGVKPGPQMGRYLKAVAQMRDEGKLENRHDAIEWLQRAILETK